jgi:3-mercaptopyruvate sulfurtransferase SseA
VALRLRDLGIDRVRPLEGGLDAWREHAFPLERIVVEEPDGAKDAQPPVPAA